MNAIRALLFSLAILPVLLMAPRAAHAAESYDNCAGTIDTLPTTISTQGVWCLKGNLSTAITSGAAITIVANNVTIDCNDFKLGGLAAGINTVALGVAAINVLNPAVRHCGIRGFMTGIKIIGDGTSGGLIEENRLDNNTSTAIDISGTGHVIRRNRIVDTGGRPSSSQTNAILAFADQSVITDNVISGVTATASGGDVVGISALGNANEVSRNYITGMIPEATGNATGVSGGGGKASSIRDNTILNPASVNGNGILALSSNICGGNRISGYSSGITGCSNAGDNFSN